jgi:hypothetical protein
MRVAIVVLLADEDRVGAREIGEHHFEIAERLAPGVEHAFRHVGRAHDRRMRWRKLRRLDERNERREEHVHHVLIVRPLSCRVN